jgi:predicted signal transduction protein with EAL and GGDEF domain
MAFSPGQTKPVEALDQADQALYRAKGAGRNAAWIWDPGRQSPISIETWRADAEADTDAPAPPPTPDPIAVAVAAPG